MNKAFIKKEEYYYYYYYMDKKRLYAGIVSVISYLVRAIIGDSKFRRVVYA